VHDRPPVQPDRQDEQRYVIDTIAAFANGKAGRHDWDDFLNCSLHDAELNRIRRAAAAVDLPLTGEGAAILWDLIEQAELATTKDPIGRKPWRMEAGAIAGLVAGAILWWVNYLPGSGIFHNLHLIVVLPALGMVAVALRNGRKGIGAHHPRIVKQNRQGRV